VTGAQRTCHDNQAQAREISYLVATMNHDGFEVSRCLLHPSRLHAYTGGDRRAPFAVIADVHENESGPIDLRMVELGGSVLREARKGLVEDALDKREETRRAARSSTSGTSVA